MQVIGKPFCTTTLFIVFVLCLFSLTLIDFINLQ